MKKVICIDNRNGGNYLTIGKMYKARDYKNNIIDYYEIFNDKFFYSPYPKKHFIEYTRLDKLNRILED